MVQHGVHNVPEVPNQRKENKENKEKFSRSLNCHISSSTHESNQTGENQTFGHIGVRVKLPSRGNKNQHTDFSGICRSTAKK